jgi:hypothetical protein
MSKKPDGSKEPLLLNPQPLDLHDQEIVVEMAPKISVLKKPSSGMRSSFQQMRQIFVPTEDKAKACKGERAKYFYNGI